MKTAIIGASAHSTPALFDSDVVLDESGFSFTFVGRDPHRLAGVGHAVDVVAAAHGYRTAHEQRPFADLETGLAEADVIVIQIRIGGYAARNWDERFPTRYGLCGDEGLGAGGLAAAWRTWPELRRLLARLSASGSTALILLLTSPVGILTRCAVREFPHLRIYGICELPWTTLVEVCDGDPAAAYRAMFSYIGVNHLGWFADVRDDRGVRVRASDVVPLKYVALGERRPRRDLDTARPSRAHELQALADSAFLAYGAGTDANVVDALRERRTPWYAHALAPLLAGLRNGDSDHLFFLTQRNAAYCPWLDDDDVIEMPFALRGGRLERRALPAWHRDDIAAVFTSLVRYEREAGDAVRSRNRSGLASALAAHPWMTGVQVGADLVDDVLAPIDRAAWLGHRWSAA